MAGDFGPQVSLGAGRGDVEAGVEESVDQGPDDFGAVEHLAAAAARSRRETVEILDLAIEEHDGNLGPGFLMHGRTTAGRLRNAVTTPMPYRVATDPSHH